jgi:hypothetical protein
MITTRARHDQDMTKTKTKTRLGQESIKRAVRVANTLDQCQFSGKVWESKMRLFIHA